MLIRTATEEDIPAAGAVAAAAYIDDEQDAFMFPGRKKHAQRYLKTKESIVRHGMKDPTATVIVAALEEGDEGWSGKADIVGFCICPIFQYASDLIDPLVSAPNASTMAKTCRLPSSNKYFCPEIKDSPQYGIMDIAVHPGFQGRGVARKLVEWGMNKAREEAVPIELSATPSGSELYTKLGFKKVGVWRWRPGMEGSDGMGGWDIMRWQAEP
ncbi:acyl-CoA N-acyltransferase [Dactylonectria macrodidyma]|uniref:Acyl-CoA N-acyltransferase n=1 Tax=Dactylonectria macrodidyma TaxID=307937 RepID=A0A9P9DVB1_9HYPO|nr:acyl-CoA N-acyltransferase [Dactylonectria macrodidyma]